MIVELDVQNVIAVLWYPYETFNKIFWYILCLCRLLIILLQCLQFKESVAQFAQENIAPHASKIDRTNYFPEVVWEWLFLYNKILSS